MSRDKTAYSQKKYEFEEAVKRVNTLKSEGKLALGEEDVLEMYSLYKQATLGDNRTPEPWMFEYIKKKKWQAWKSRAGMLPFVARALYCKKLSEIEEKFGIE